MTLALAAAPPQALAGARPADPSLYRVPRGPLAALADVPAAPSAEVAPDGRTLVMLERPALPPVAQLARDERGVAPDLWVDAATRAPGRALSWNRLTLVDLPDGRERRVVGLPEDARLRDAAFAPDGRTLAFTHAGSAGVELWLADVAVARARRVPRLRLHAVFAPPCRWLHHGRSLVCRALPDPPPRLPAAPQGPRALETPESRAHAAAGAVDDVAPVSDDFDTRFFGALAQVQVVRVGLDGRLTPVGAPGALRRAEPSPDGRYLLVEAHHAPYAFTVETTRFPRRVEVWDLDGRVVARVADLQLARALPAGADAVRPGPREFLWRADAPATLAWIEADDADGAPSDRVIALAAPFDGAPRPLARGLRGRVTAISWADDGLALAVTESRREGRLRRYAFAPGAAAADGVRLVDDARLDDPQRDPGIPALTVATRGAGLLFTAGRARGVYLLRGPAAEGQPALDRLDLDSGRATTLWRSQAPYLERPVALLDADRLITRRESRQEPPDFYLRDLRAATLRRLTGPRAAVPGWPSVRREVLRYSRADGVALSADLHVPAEWTPAQGPLPALVWIYPEAAASDAPPGRRPGSPYEYAVARPLDARAWALDGYAVLEPAVPVVAESGEPAGGTYAAQVVAGVEAAADELVRRGVAARERLALGGHSFGAGMVALVLARTNRFRCALALSGSYNRTLTPFGFQGEARTLWSAPQAYLELSPLAHADRIHTPLLLVHGQADTHPATPPEQSERLFAALRALGARARLVLLPHEGHNPRGRESVLHVLAEIQDWLARWLGAPARPAPSSVGRSRARPRHRQADGRAPNRVS